MKKALTTLGAFIFLLAPSFALAQTVNTDCFIISGAGTSAINQKYTYQGNDGGALNLPIFQSDDDNYSLFQQDASGNGYRIKGHIASGLDYYTADSSSGSFTTASWGVSAGSGPAPTVSFCPPPPPPDTGLPAQIAAAEQGMASTTGFNIGSVLQWSGDNLLKIFIGSGVAIIYGFRYWIVAMLIISLIVLFAFRGMRYFRH